MTSAPSSLTMPLDAGYFDSEDGRAPAVDGRVEDALRALQKVVGSEGNAGTVIVRDGAVLWAGDQTRRLVPIWSCTKSILSTCLGLLWDDGRCSPNDFVAAYLSPLTSWYPEVTLQHLATFTSGVHLDDFSLDVGPPDFAPGTAFHYSPESNLLALILTQIAGESLADLFRRRIADPLGMDPTGWEWKSAHRRDGIPINGGTGVPESGMHMTAHNLARFGWLFANGGQWDGHRLISERYIAYATRPHVSAATPMHDPAGWYKPLPGTYGLNWWTNGVTAEGKRLWPSAPASMFAAQGNRNNICLIVPEWKLVLARTAQDEIIDVSLFDEALSILGAESNARN